MFNFRKKKSYTEKDARQVLIKEGWLRKYYYALKVLESCKKSKNLHTTINARRWAINILDLESLDLIRKKYPSELVNLIEDITFDFTEHIYDVHYETMKKIMDNSTNKVEKNVITNFDDYKKRCDIRNEKDEIVSPDFKVHEMNYEVEMYSPDNKFLGSTKDDLVFVDWRARIKRKGVEGYYIKINGQTIPIDKNGSPKEWINGMFDAYTFALMDLV